jgi:hypothetical protein
MPIIEEFLDEMAGAKVFIKLVFTKSEWHKKMRVKQPLKLTMVTSNSR